MSPTASPLDAGKGTGAQRPQRPVPNRSQEFLTLAGSLPSVYHPLPQQKKYLWSIRRLRKLVPLVLGVGGAEGGGEETPANHHLPSPKAGPGLQGARMWSGRVLRDN